MNLKVSIMQPYFFPYLGYFQLMVAVDLFIVYDNIQFTKKGWIQRNRILLNGKDEMFSLPLRKASDFLDIRDRHLAENYLTQNKKTLRKIENAYLKAPYFHQVFPLIQNCFLFEQHNNLFDFLFFSINEVRNFLDINVDIKISSDIEFGSERLKNKMRVIKLCKSVNAKTYINPIGGQLLYDKQEFKKNDLLLKFIQMQDFHYQQFQLGYFVKNLSIIDVLMFNSKKDVVMLLENYNLI